MGIGIVSGGRVHRASNIGRRSAASTTGACEPLV